MRQSFVAVIMVGLLAASCGGKCVKAGSGDSPDAGRKPPEGAVVLLAYGDGAPSMDEWTNKSWETYPDGTMHVGKGDNHTVRSFGDIDLHVEFMIPAQTGTERNRGNSGVYLQERYEVQILETFGIPPDDGACGAIYKVAAPRVNAALPTEKWQTYDITFQAPKLKEDGTVAGPGLISVVHNGIKIHDRVEVTYHTGGGAEGVAARAAIKLQDHGHDLKFRNIWLVER